MSFIVENKVMWRKIVPIMFILSMLGPWTFDRLYIPAEYPCKFRLEGDFCGMPLAGYFVVFMLISGFFPSLGAVLTGTFTGQAREFLMGLFLLLILLPFFSTLSFIWKRETRRLQTINIIACGLACIFSLLILIADWNAQTFRLWGLWLYVVSAVGAIIFEILASRSDTEPGRDI